MGIKIKVTFRIWHYIKNLNIKCDNCKILSYRNIRRWAQRFYPWGCVL